VTGLTPYQTVGPFFDFALTVAGCEFLAPEGTPGRRIVLEGTVLDGDRQPVPDALIEIWQADSSGRYSHPADSTAREGCSFRGFGRCGTDDEGRFAFATVIPGRVRGPDGLQAPHVVLGVLGRGVLTRLVTRVYFEGEPSNQDDSVLSRVPEHRRATLLARALAPERYQFNVVLQGIDETVFFDV
jgi:protocatechuate 3,4-dioxygenase, alpha subunit